MTYVKFSLVVMMHLRVIGEGSVCVLKPPAGCEVQREEHR